MVAGAALTTAVLAACGTATPTSSQAPSVPPQVSTPAITNAGHLRVCTALSTGNPPTYYSDAEHKPTGAEVDMANSVGAHLGLAVDFFDVPFASIIPALQGGQCDVIMSSLYIKPEREQIVDFVPYLLSGSALAVAKGNPKHITGMDDTLCGLKMTATVGKTAALLATSQREKCTTDGKPSLQLNQVDTTTAGVQQVMTGQVDAYAGELPVVLYYRDKQPDTFQMGGSPFGTIKVGAAVKKGNADLQAAIKKAFDQMKASGEYSANLKKWNLTDLALQ
jgi:polar amino acid transport system substrate-binding protein